MSGGFPEGKNGGGGDGPRPVSAQTQAFWLLAWLVNNIGITMLNKHVFSVADFDYPLVVRERERERLHVRVEFFFQVWSVFGRE